MDAREQQIREKNYPVSAQADVEWLLAEIGRLRSKLTPVRETPSAREWRVRVQDERYRADEAERRLLPLQLASRRLLDATEPRDIDDARSALWGLLVDAKV